MGTTECFTCCVESFISTPLKPATLPLIARGSTPPKRPPLIAEVTSTLADGVYGPGHDIEILIRYTAPVLVYGTPRLWLDLGDADGYAECHALKVDTDDTLAFVYVVGEGTCACACF